MQLHVPISLHVFTLQAKRCMAQILYQDAFMPHGVCADRLQCHFQRASCDELLNRAKPQKVFCNKDIVLQPNQVACSSLHSFFMTADPSSWG